MRFPKAPALKHLTVVLALFLLVIPLVGLTLGGVGVLAVKNGDINGDGSRDISDAIALLNWLFSNGPEPVPCGSEPC